MFSTHRRALALPLAIIAGLLLAATLPAAQRPAFTNVPYANVPRAWGQTYVPKSKAPAKEIVAVKTRGLSPAEMIALTCLQGLVAREQPRLFLIRGAEDQFWLDEHRRRGVITEWINETNWPVLFSRFQDRIKGAVIPDTNLYRGTLVAANVAACRDLIVASPEIATRLHLPVVMDLRGRFARYADAVRWLWTTYRSDFNPCLCDFRQPELMAHATFDYSYEWRAFMFWPAGQKDAEFPGADPASERMAIERVLADMPPGGVSVGFPAGTAGTGVGEPPGVRLLSDYGKALVCNNHMANCSFYSGVAAPALKQPVQPAAPRLDTSKVYIALVLSDGDNQILWPGFFRRYFEHRRFGSFPLAFGMGPAIRELQPVIAQWYFEHATPQTEFICDVSGAGYMQPDHFAAAYADPQRVWADFLSWTSRLMQGVGERSIRTVGGTDANIAR